MSGVLTQENILKYSSAALVVVSVVIAAMMVSSHQESWRPIVVGGVMAASGYAAYTSWWANRT
ncbi:unknown [Singapore grouper iridovirus]|uniref:Transmembrane protein n=2 Tax=Singapore grouper iridovirus TaxID=262968 RepID=Q5GAB8_9VIRU|nr:hypothetical protein ORF011L [Singapore grouper iridovirus]AAS18026.1 unknown [Singapore grouper iridovirus]AAV91125.1 unknown protein [Grouper iridovirus]WAU86720.1 hypothetical protein ORF011L [Singapore grouper iridovirus]